MAGLLDFLFPPRCMACGELLDIDFELRICDGCYLELQPCEDCVSGILSAYKYTDVSRMIMHRFKYAPNPVFGAHIGLLMANRLAEYRDIGRIDGVVAVPLHRDKAKQRGFNQSELLAKAIAQNISVPFISDAVVRTRATVQQSSLRHSERMRNTAGAFAPGKHAHKVDGKAILLVDDICTTGSTILSCSKALCSADIITSFTFARVYFES